jgi:outer membrane protein assembly factor BamB
MDRFVYAISTDGKQLWAKEMAGAVVASPVLSEDDGTLFVGSMGNDFVALRTSDGQLAWSFTAQDSIWGQAVLADNKLYFADTGGFLYILDPLNGTEKNRVQIGEPVIGGLLALPDGIALVTEKGNLKVLEFDGATRWEARISGNVFQSPVFSDDYLMVAAVDGDNMIYAFDVKSGAQKWSVTPKK